VKFNLATLTYRCLHDTAPCYLSALLGRVADVLTRRRLRLCLSDALLVRPTRLVTIGDRAILVAAAKLWNKLPGDITAAQSLTAFHRQLKTFKFCHSCGLYVTAIRCSAFFAIATQLTMTLTLRSTLACLLQSAKTG
jgi:hypothetical protein